MTVIKEFDPFGERDQFGDKNINGSRQQDFDRLFQTNPHKPTLEDIDNMLNQKEVVLKLHKDIIKDLDLLAGIKRVAVPVLIRQILEAYTNEYFGDGYDVRN